MRICWWFDMLNTNILPTCTFWKYKILRIVRSINGYCTGSTFNKISSLETWNFIRNWALVILQIIEDAVRYNLSKWTRIYCNKILSIESRRMYTWDTLKSTIVRWVTITDTLLKIGRKMETNNPLYVKFRGSILPDTL